MENKRLPGAYVLHPDRANKPVMRKQFTFRDAKKLYDFLKGNASNNTYAIYFGLNGQEMATIKSNIEDIKQAIENYESFDVHSRSMLLNEAIWGKKPEPAKPVEEKKKKDKPEKKEKTDKKQRWRPKKVSKVDVKIICDAGVEGSVEGFTVTKEQAKQVSELLHKFVKENVKK